MTRNILLLTYPHAAMVAGLDFFLRANEARPEQARYITAVASRGGGTIPTSSGIQVVTEPLSTLDEFPIDTLLISGGPGVRAAAKDDDLRDWIRHRASSIRRICSLCTGTHLLAATGLLDGRRATTHWREVEQMREEFPAVTFVGDLIYCRDGSYWTSAGATAAYDLALALIREDFGHAVAIHAAREQVVYVWRNGGQAQYSEPLSAQARGREDFSDLHAWIAEHLGEPLTAETLAERVGMSTRNFYRLYVASVGRTPAQTLEAMRVEMARRLLDTAPASFKRISRQCGFRDERQLRAGFKRSLGVTPEEYARSFGPEGPRRSIQPAA